MRGSATGKEQYERQILDVIRENPKKIVNHEVSNIVATTPLETDTDEKAAEVMDKTSNWFEN